MVAARRAEKRMFVQGQGQGHGQDAPAHVFLCQGPHWAHDCPSHHGAIGKRAVSRGKGPKSFSVFFDRHIWKETRVTTLEPRCAGKEICVDASLNLTHPVKPLRFSFANGEEDVSTSVPPVSYLPWRVISFCSCTQRARTCVVGS